MKTLASSMAFGATYFYLSLSTALAQGFGGDLPNINGLAQGGVGETRTTIESIVNTVLGFLALIAVIFVIVGGIRIMTAGGNEENVTKGRKTIIYAIIGLLVIFFARVIVGFVTQEIAQ